MNNLRILKANAPHNYPQLVRRWRRVEKSSGLVMRLMIEVSGFPIYYLQTQRPHPDHRWFYCSAGIHGDEAAGPEALLQWAETSPKTLQQLNLFLFPCLNPWGLVHNLRQDSNGNDLNRTYHDDSVPQTAEHKRLITGMEFDLALFLHEDYDARGVYIYERPSRKPFIAKDLIAAASQYIPAESRGQVDGEKCRGGVIRKKMTSYLMPLAPEAFFLHFSLNSGTMTVETPSEFHIDQRVAAHMAILHQAAKYCRSLEKKKNSPPSSAKK